MFNRITGQQASTHNQNLPVATGQTGGIQAPTPAVGVLAAVPSARVAVVNNVRDQAQSFKQELRQWVGQAPTGYWNRRNESVRRIFAVYESGGTRLWLSDIELSSLPNLACLGQLQTLELSFYSLSVKVQNPQAIDAFFKCLRPLSNLKTLNLQSNNLGALAESPDVAEAFFDGLGELSQLQTLVLPDNNLDVLVKSPRAAKAFFDCLAKLDQLQSLDLGRNNLDVRDIQLNKVFFDGLGQLAQLKTLGLSGNNLGSLAQGYMPRSFVKGFLKLHRLQALDLSGNNLGALANKPLAAEAFFKGLGNRSQLQTLDLGSNNLGELVSNPLAAEAFFKGLGNLSQLQTLDLGSNNLGELVSNPLAAKAFFDALGELGTLQTLVLYKNNCFGKKLAENPDAVKALFDGLGKLHELQSLNLVFNDFGALVDKPPAAEAFFNGLAQLRQLKNLDFSWNNLGRLAENPDAAEAFFNCFGLLHELKTLNLSYNDLDSRAQTLEESLRFRAILRKHNIETEHGAIIELGKPWPTATESELFKKCATVTDAISAYGMLGHAYGKGELSWVDVQSNLKTICSRVAKNLIGLDIKNSESLAKVRDQELEYLLIVVQHGEKIGALTEDDALTLEMHIQTNVRINHAYSAIRDLQQNQQVLLGGLQSVGSVLGQHMAHTAQLQTQFRQCFQKLAENQQQLLENQKQLASESRQDNQTLKLEIERLKGKQEEIADNLHQVGLKMLNAKRIRAVGGALATGVSFLPLLGPAIVEGSKAIANALGVANARGFEEGLGNLKESLSRISGESVFQNTREDLKGWTLGETLQGYGIELPDDAITTRFAAITLGELSDGIQSGTDYLADREESLQSDSQASPEAPAPLAGLTIALPTVLGQQLQQSTTQPHLPVLAQPANSSTSANLSAEHARRLNAINAPQPTANQAGAQQSAGALRRIESTGSMATVDDTNYELAAEIKYHDPSDVRSTARLREAIQAEVKAELDHPGSTGLTTPTIPTRNSSQPSMTLMDIAVHYGRAQAFEILEDETEGQVKLKSGNPNIAIPKARNRTRNRVGMYNNEAERVNNS